LAWRPGRRFVRWLAVIPIVSFLAGAVLLGSWPYVRQHITVTEKQDWFGPFDWSGAWTDLADGLLHGTILSLSLMIVWWVAIRWPRYRRLMQTAALVVVAMELGIAQRQLLGYASCELWRQKPRALSFITHDPQYRVFRQVDTMSPSFAKSTSSQRFEELVRWSRNCLEPRYPLPYHVPLIGVIQNIAGNEYDTLLDAARTHGRRTLRQGNLPDASILDLMAARTAIVATDERELLSNSHEVAEGMYLGERPSSLPRAWIVHEVEVHPRFESHSIRAAQNYMMRLAFPRRLSRDWSKLAIVESAETISLPPPPVDVATGESCQITHADPLRVEIAAKLNADGIVVLSDQFYPGWELTVESKGAAESDGVARRRPIFRTNLVMRGALLPAGSHRLVYRYRPKSVLVGAIISGLTFAGLCGFALVGWRRRPQRSGGGTAR
jgi:hypothetical protein